MKRAIVAALAATMLIGATVVAQDESAETDTAATPAATATTTPEAEAPRIDWASSGIELFADELRLREGDRVVTAPGEVLPLGATYADEGQLEAWWYAQGSQQRLNLNLDLDETDWWIDSIWATTGTAGTASGSTSRGSRNARRRRSASHSRASTGSVRPARTARHIGPRVRPCCASTACA